MLQAKKIVAITVRMIAVILTVVQRVFCEGALFDELSIALVKQSCGLDPYCC